MEVFNIYDTGDYELVANANILKEILNEEENVYVILTHDWKICWIWLGKTCNVRKKFSGARTARSILGERKLAYSVKTVDSGDEPKIFKEILESPISKTYKTESASLEHVKIQKMVLNHDLPSKDFKRQAVLIGNKFYVAVEVKVMGNVTHKYEPSEFLPEGMSELPNNYLGRLFVKHGRVEALEFLTQDGFNKKAEEKIAKIKEKKEEIEKPKDKIEVKNSETKNKNIETIKQNIQDKELKEGVITEISPEPQVKTVRRKEYYKKKRKKKKKKTKRSRSK